MLHRYTPVLRAVLQFGAGLAICRLAANAGAQEEHHHKDMAGMAMGDRAKTANGAKPVFVASTAKSFATLMDDAMAVMDDGMRQTPVNSRSVHDFITMMMPRHHGAVDMAKAVLLYNDDPEVRNLALGIIAEQQNEIHVMQAWLKRHPQPITGTEQP